MDSDGSPGMRGIYSHITPGMRKDLTVLLQELWVASLHERARIAGRSPVGVLDTLLKSFWEARQFAATEGAR
jgi:hypothetical protein